MPGQVLCLHLPATAHYSEKPVPNAEPLSFDDSAEGAFLLAGTAFDALVLVNYIGFLFLA